MTTERTGVSGAGSARCGRWLTAVLAVPVIGFFACAGFSPGILAVPVTPGQPVTAWFLYGLALIAGSVALGRVYVLAANRAAARGAVPAAGLLLLATPAQAAAEPSGSNPVAIGLTVLGPSVWVKVLGYPAPLFPLDPPTLVTMPLAFAVCIGVSVLDRSRRAEQDRAGYAEQRQRMGGAIAMAAE